MGRNRKFPHQPIHQLYAMGHKDLCKLMGCQDWRTARRRIQCLGIPLLRIRGKPTVAFDFLRTHSINLSTLLHDYCHGGIDAVK